MRLLWPVLLVLGRGLYLVYALWCLLFPLALLGGAVAVWCGRGRWLALAIVPLLAFGTYLLAKVYARRTPADPQPFQSAFMAWFGTLRWFWNVAPSYKTVLGLPSGYLVENPGGYRISARETRQVLATVQPGDILLRGYRGYVDGALIRRSAVCSPSGYRPGWFTHVALYVGPLTAADQAKVPADYADEQRGFFAQGPQMVVHAMAQGVHTEDLLTFCRCDYLAVLRLAPELRGIPGMAGTLLHKVQETPKPKPSPSDRQSMALEQALQENRLVARESAIEAAKQTALEKIGTEYDFDCSDTTRFHRFSCAELVYYCLRGVHTALNLKLQMHGLYPLGAQAKHWAVLKRNTITPDDFFALRAQGSVACVWQDAVTGARDADPGASPLAALRP